MDKKVYKGTTFTRNSKNFKENIWKAKKSGFQFFIFRKNLKWRIESQNSKSLQILNVSELGFDELEQSFEWIVNFKNDGKKD